MTARKVQKVQPKKAPSKNSSLVKAGMKQANKRSSRAAAQPSSRPAPHTSKMLLTVQQAAAELQLSERKIWSMVARNVIRSIKADGRSRRIPLSALQEYIESQLEISA